MIYLSITQIDAVTGVLCTAEPMRTGPSYPQVKGFVFVWADQSNWPIATTPEGAHTRAPLFFGTCDDDADISIVGVIATHTAEEYASLKTTEHQSRKPYPSWVGNEETMTWAAPTPMPTDDKNYVWDEPTTLWIEVTNV